MTTSGDELLAKAIACDTTLFRDVLEAAIRGLPEDYETVVRQCDLEHRSVFEVASSMGRSVVGVCLLRARARRYLREVLSSPSKFFSNGA